VEWLIEQALLFGSAVYATIGGFEDGKSGTGWVSSCCEGKQGPLIVVFARQAPGVSFVPSSFVRWKYREGAAFESAIPVAGGVSDWVRVGKGKREPLVALAKVMLSTHYTV
jgi:hypothetical protein